jgi:hypothetical protein
VAARACRSKPGGAAVGNGSFAPAARAARVAADPAAASVSWAGLGAAASPERARARGVYAALSGIHGG